MQSEAGTRTQRTLIFHYHIFKNAGTSIDETLRQNFEPHWAEHEFAAPGPERTNVEAVSRYLRQHPQLIAFSSHTALLPAPILDGTVVFPIIFVRHPIDRLHSAYVFERAQRADTAGARLAKEHDFAGYLRELLKPQRRRQARNFQTFRLSLNEPHGSGTDAERAAQALNNLPFVGLVEAFEHSIKRLESLLRPLFPKFRAVNVEKNSVRLRTTSLEERLAAIERELGTQFFEELCAANDDDLKIHRAVRTRYLNAPEFQEHPAAHKP
jgi:hypothetical protein